MGWSWPSFGAGVAVSAVACLAMLRGCGETDPSGRAAPHGAPSDVPGAAVASGGLAVGDPREEATRRRRRSAESESAAEPSPALRGEATAPEGAAEEVPAADEHEVGAEAHESVMSADLTTMRIVDSSGFVFTLEGGSIVIRGAAIGDHLGATRAAQALARSKATAEAYRASGRAATDGDLQEMLESSDDVSRETAIGLAATADPPRIGFLLRLARDEDVPPSTRATALAAAVEASGNSAAVAAVVVELASSAEIEVRRAALERLGATGAAGANLAAELLASGDYDPSLLDALAAAVAPPARAAGRLRGRPESAVTWAVLRASAALDPPNVGVAQRLPSILRPLVALAEAVPHVPEMLRFAAKSGQTDFLREVIANTTQPTAVRLAALDGALAEEACAAARPALLAVALGDGRNPVELLRASIAHAGPDVLSDPIVREALERLAESHANAWLREEARAKLQDARSGSGADDASLVIHRGIYGKDGLEVDVTTALRSMVVGGRLVVDAGRALAGDPNYGIVKDLWIEYSWRGQRRTRLIREYETLVLP